MTASVASPVAAAIRLLGIISVGPAAAEAPAAGRLVIRAWSDGEGGPSGRVRCVLMRVRWVLLAQ